MTKNIIIIVLCAIVILFLASDATYTEDAVITKTDTIYKDTVIKKWYKGNTISYKIIDSIPYPVKIHDTQFIVNDYNAIRNYRDTILFDSNSIVINDTITQNKIIGRSLEMNLREKKIIVTNTVTKNDNNAIYIGGGSNFKSAFVGFQYKRNNQMIGLSFVSDKSFQLSYYVRIR